MSLPFSKVSRHRARRRWHRGYTAVEVLLAGTVLVIGAAGVMSMQRGAIQGNLDARKLDMANSIAREWIERLRRDATMWTLPSAANPTATANLQNARILWQGLATPAGGGAAAEPGTGWFLPTQYTATAYPADGTSPGFDLLGRDLIVGDLDKAVFCTHVKIDTMAVNPAIPAEPLLLRGTVRVFWQRQLLMSAVPGGACGTFFNVAAYENTSVATNQSTYRFVYATTALRKNPAL